jgi:cyclic pyranopterin phosphate synthase
MSTDSLRDTQDRPLRDLRMSVTDRCNFRCRYCMPREHFGAGYRFLPSTELLSFEELGRVARAAVSLGARKLRVTGGEPLLRPNLAALIASLRSLSGVEIALTTNGALLSHHASDLRRAGLDRVTVSLDALDDATFRKLSDVDVPVARVLSGIDAATAAGFPAPKINAVIRRGVNEHAILDLARRFKGTGHVVRFIEYMGVGGTNGWHREQVVTAREIVQRLQAELPLEPVAEPPLGRVATRWRYLDGGGEIGVIASVSEPFCGGCTRARLSADGRLFTCLFAHAGTDLRTSLRGGASHHDLVELMGGVWRRRADRYSELRPDQKRRLPRIEMSYVGG